MESAFESAIINFGAEVFFVAVLLGYARSRTRQQFVRLEVMSNTFWSTIFILGAVQGSFLAAVIFFQRHTNVRAARILSLIVALVVLFVVAEALQGQMEAVPASLLAFLNISSELAFGPLLYLLARSIFFPEEWNSRTVALHFVPLAAGFAFSLFSWLRLEDPALVMTRSMGQFFPILPFLIFKAVVMFSYVIATYRLLSVAESGARTYKTGRRQIRPGRLKVWLLLLATVLLLIYGSSILDEFGIVIGPEPDHLSGLVFFLLVFLIAAVLLLRPWVLSLNASQTNDQKLARDAEQLRSHLESSRAWSEPELRLADVAEQLGWTNNQTSAVINKGMQSSFHELVTSYRLDEFERLAKDSSADEQTVLKLAFDAGFNSKASFYRVFRSRHGVTPVQYLASSSRK